MLEAPEVSSTRLHIPKLVVMVISVLVNDAVDRGVAGAPIEFVLPVFIFGDDIVIELEGIVFFIRFDDDEMFEAAGGRWVLLAHTFAVGVVDVSLGCLFGI